MEVSGMALHSHPFKPTFPFNLGLPNHSVGKHCWIISAFKVLITMEPKHKNHGQSKSLWSPVDGTALYYIRPLINQDNHSPEPSSPSLGLSTKKKSMVAIFQGPSLWLGKLAQFVHCSLSFCGHALSCFLSDHGSLRWSSTHRKITAVLVSILALRVG